MTDQKTPPVVTDNKFGATTTQDATGSQVINKAQGDTIGRSFSEMGERIRTLEGGLREIAEIAYYVPIKGPDDEMKDILRIARNLIGGGDE